MEHESIFTAKQVGARIKERRKEIGISMETLGNELGVNKSTIQRYEAHGIEPKKNYLLVSIANALDTTVEWLTGQSDERDLDTATLCRADIDKHISAFIQEVTTVIPDEPHQQLMTTMLGRLVDMFGIICNHFGTAMEEISRVENDTELRKSLIQYALNSGDVAEKVYRREMEQPIEDFKQMADCLLHLFDKNSRSIYEMADILEKAKRNINK